MLNIYVFYCTLDWIEEVDKLRTPVLVHKLGYMCHIYNPALNGSRKKVSKVQTVKYVNGILTTENVTEYIPMGKICVDLIGPH